VNQEEREHNEVDGVKKGADLIALTSAFGLAEL